MVDRLRDGRVAAHVWNPKVLVVNTLNLKCDLLGTSMDAKIENHVSFRKLRVFLSLLCYALVDVFNCCITVFNSNVDYTLRRKVQTGYGLRSKRLLNRVDKFCSRIIFPATELTETSQV